MLTIYGDIFKYILIIEMHINTVGLIIIPIKKQLTTYV